MAKRSPSTLDLRRYAALGAEARLVEIATEAAAIYRNFPELRDRVGARLPSGEGGRRGRSGKTAGPGAGRQRPRRQRRMSAEARKRIGDAQRARWAKVRAEKEAGATASGASRAASAKAATGRPAKAANGAKHSLRTKR